MTMRPADASPPLRPPTRPGPFQLTRFFTATSLVAFVVLATALYFLEQGEQQFFAQVQREQNGFFAQVQEQLVRDQKENDRTNLVSVHEAGHVALTNVFANALWTSHFAPVVTRAGSIAFERCRPAPGVAPQPGSQQACVAAVGRQVMALPGFAAADTAARALMRGTTVFKVKVYDLRGLTVYSSELAQIGEDKSANAGWRLAVAGKAASELVHRNRFSAFEGEVENRDLIQSYVPVLASEGAVGGVFEIYSDVTPLLRQVEQASVRIAEATTHNQARVEAVSVRNQATVDANATKLLLIVAALLVFVYGALLFFVRNGQRIIDAEARAREQAALREQQWHRDKMATMAAMAANISHEVGNPLAIISGLAQDIAEWRAPGDFSPASPRMIVEQTARIADMTRRITDFATAGRDSVELLDINQSIRAVCDFLAFDKRFRGTPIELQLAEGLPACQGVPDHLTEVLMGLLHALEEVGDEAAGPDRRIVVASAVRGDEVVLRFVTGADGAGRIAAGDPRLESARRRIAAMGGRIECAGDALEICLPCATPGADAAGA